MLLLHVSTLFCRLQGSRSYSFAKLHKPVNNKTQLDTHSDTVHTGQHNGNINIDIVYTVTIQDII